MANYSKPLKKSVLSSFLPYTSTVAMDDYNIVGDHGRQTVGVTGFHGRNPSLAESSNLENSGIDI
jgi:hypothetical protein